MQEWFLIDTFANPEAFFLLLVIPAYLFWYFGIYTGKRLVIRLSYDPNQLKRPKIKLSFLRFVPIVLQIAGMILLIVAIARPQSASETLERKSEGIDIMLLLDTSASMEAADFSPNRLEVAKSTAEAFINGRVGDRIGIVLFAEEAFSYSPLTLDYEFLTELVRDINFKILPKQGTAIGSAIAIGINRLKETAGNTRIMVLLTDGANNRGKIDPITAAKLAKMHKIKIYCIGVGNVSGGTIPTPSGSGTVPADLDEESLVEIARITNSAYFHSTNEKSLEEIFQQISLMEKVEVTEEMYREVADKYPPFLFLSILCWALAFLSMNTFMYNPLEQ